MQSLRTKLRKALAVVLFLINVLGCWLWWESYKATVDWSKRSELFPLPFYIISLPHWLVVDLAITLIILSALGLTIMNVVRD